MDKPHLFVLPGGLALKRTMDEKGNNLLRAQTVQVVLSRLDDEAVADLLRDYVLADLDVASPASEIMSEAMLRLSR